VEALKRADVTPVSVIYHNAGETPRIRPTNTANRRHKNIARTRTNWKRHQKAPILPFMDDTPHHKPPADCDPPMPSAADLLAESEAVLAAGLTVDGDALIRELRASADQREAEQQTRKAARRR
jgi:hypothetical protein